MPIVINPENLSEELLSAFLTGIVSRPDDYYNTRHANKNTQSDNKNKCDKAKSDRDMLELERIETINDNFTLVNKKINSIGKSFTNRTNNLEDKLDKLHTFTTVELLEIVRDLSKRVSDLESAQKNHKCKCKQDEQNNKSTTPNEKKDQECFITFLNPYTNTTYNDTVPFSKIEELLKK